MSDLFERAAAAIDTRRVVEIARALCSVSSDDPRAEGPRAEIIADALERAGADVHVADVVEGRPNVIARVKGEGRRAPLVLQGHIDAGVYASGWTRSADRPWESGGRLYGGGITDMLGGVAAMAAAVEAAARFGPLPGDLVLHATMYHDGIGLGAKYALVTEDPPKVTGSAGSPPI